MPRFDHGDPRPAGNWRRYRKVTVLRMLKMDEPFETVSREGESKIGQPGDFLVEDGFGGYYPVEAGFHEKNYREAGMIDPVLFETGPTDAEVRRALQWHERCVVYRASNLAELLAEQRIKLLEAVEIL